MNRASCFKRLPAHSGLFLTFSGDLLSHDGLSAVSEAFPSCKGNTEYIAFLAWKWCEKLLITLIFQSSITKLSSPTFKNVYWLKPISHPDGQPWPHPSRSPCSNFYNCFFVPCTQRVVQVSATTMDDALWNPAAGTASANQDGEGLGVT